MTSRPSQSVAVWTLLFVILSGFWTCETSAEDWMYQRSYYSHWPTAEGIPNHPLPEHRSAYRPAYYREAMGFSVRSAYRINNFVLRNGPRTDRTIYQEGYIEFQP